MESVYVYFIILFKVSNISFLPLLLDMTFYYFDCCILSVPLYTPHLFILVICMPLSLSVSSFSFSFFICLFLLIYAFYILSF